MVLLSCFLSCDDVAMEKKTMLKGRKRWNLQRTFFIVCLEVAQQVVL